MRLRRAPLALLAACLLGLAACGESDDAREPTAATAPTGTTGPTAEASTGASEVPSEPAPPPTTSSPAQPPEPESADSGDEEPIRQPVSFRVGGEDVEPGSISVSPFLTIELKLQNVGPTPLIVRLVGTDTAIELPAGATRTKRLEGLEAGLYTLSVNDGAQVATVVVGDDVGP